MLAITGCVHRPFDCDEEPDNRFCRDQQDGGNSDADAGVNDGGTDADGIDAGPCDGACGDDTPYCVDDACVQCRDHADCGGTTPICDAGTCRACAASADCEDRDTSFPVCASDGACVECTVEERSACGANACRPDQRCSAYPTGQLACQPCDTDVNCASGHLCVDMTYANPPLAVVFDPVEVKRLLAHLHCFSDPLPLHPARAPPEHDESFDFP